MMPRPRIPEQLRSRLPHPQIGIAEKIGFAVGALILLVGYSKDARRRRLGRIEEKLDDLTGDDE